MKKIALFEGTGKKSAIEWAEITAVKLKGLNVPCCAQKELIDKFNPDLHDYIKPLDIKEFEKFADVMITFGGDGTILAAARATINSELPIMGFNVGKLGFLAEFSVNELDANIDNVLKGNYRVIERAVLETILNGEPVYALNDFVIEKRDTSHMITLQAFANKHYIGDYRADGVILTTPTGSTAYSLSSGGPIMTPNAKALCITPVSPHSLTLRPLVLPDSYEISFKVKSQKNEANLVADGFVACVLQDGDSVVFRLSQSCIKLIKPLEGSFYDLLRKKLLWAASMVNEDRD